MNRIALIGFLIGAMACPVSAGPDPRGILELEGYGNSDAAGITSKRGRNDFTIKETLASGDNLFFIKGYGYNGTAFGTNAAASIEFIANQAWTSTANGTKIVFKTTPDGTATPATAMTLDDDGNLSIAGTLTATGGATSVSSITVSTQLLAPVPSTQTIAAGGTVAADACGGIKRVDAGGAVTTDTTNTFTAPTAALAGCVMHLKNVGGTHTITLDTNANFKSAGAANVSLAAGDTIIVGTDGSFWYQFSALLDN